MQFATVERIGRYLFAAAVIGILIYIVVYVHRINTGNWTIDGSDDDVLKFISPKKDVIFTVQQGNQGITVKNYLVKGDEHGLQFYTPDLAKMARMRKGQVDVGEIAILDRSGPVSADSGVAFVDLSRGQALANINENVLHWPKPQLLIKSETQGGNPVFQAYDLKNNRVILQEPKAQLSRVPYNLI